MRNIDYISVDGRSAICSDGLEYQVGEVVAHQDTDAGTAIILSFEIDKEENEVKVWTNKGYAHLAFLEKL